MVADTAKTIWIAISLGLFILLTITGNSFVIYAIVTEKDLQKMENKLILSLAFADLFVAVLVLPVSTYNEIHEHKWALSAESCGVYLSVSILFLSSSIFHLLAIAVDRYWAVTNVMYARNRPPSRVYLLIGGAWILAVTAAAGVLLFLLDGNFYRRLEKTHNCLNGVEWVYTVPLATILYFVPLTITVFLYWNIFKRVRARIHSRPGAPRLPVTAQKLTPQNEKGQNVFPSERGEPNTQGDVTNVSVLNKNSGEIPSKATECNRERKTAKILIIITGAFIFCWTPFVTTHCYMTTCFPCEINFTFLSVVLWLAYVNSLINPVIYTIFSPYFRKAFERIVFG